MKGAGVLHFPALGHPEVYVAGQRAMGRLHLDFACGRAGCAIAVGPATMSRPVEVSVNALNER